MKKILWLAKYILGIVRWYHKASNPNSGPNAPTRLTIACKNNKLKNIKYILSVLEYKNRYFFKLTDIFKKYTSFLRKKYRLHPRYTKVISAILSLYSRPANPRKKITYEYKASSIATANIILPYTSSDIYRY